MRLEHFFGRHQVFTGDELSAFLASESPRNPRTQDALLLYHVKSWPIGQSASRPLRRRFARGVCRVLSRGSLPADRR
mgnify:CR=1 FL=1